jgi:putative hydrolase of the HAD superfamily
MSPKFLYFDMGNVLLRFDHQRACRQIAELIGIDAARVRQTLFGGDLHERFERGEIDEQGFYDTVCRELDCRPNLELFFKAFSDIFDVNSPILPLIVHLESAGYRLGILSNTNPPDWSHCCRHFGIIPEAFETAVMSFEVGASKPERKIFEWATERAGVGPEEIFFTDDHPLNVEGARSAGWDAVPYRSVVLLARQLRERGIRCNF